MGSRMPDGRQMLSAICRPLAEPISPRNLSISVSIMPGVRPVSSRERGGVGQ